MTRHVRAPMKIDPGFRAPDTQPEDMLCARVYIPNDPLHVAALWGSVAHLTTWLAWERGGTKGKDAASVWKIAYDASRSHWESCYGDCGIMDMRQNPSQPCVIQKQTDCAGEWEDAADIRLCVPKMRFLNGVLQQDTTGSGDWVDAGDPDAPYDDRTDGAYVPAWETPPEGQDGACLAAENAIAFSRQVVTAYATLIDGGADFIASLLYWASTVQILAAIANVIVELTATLQSLMTGFTGDWGDVASYDYADDIRCIIYSAYSPDGTMTGENWATIGTAIQTLVDEEPTEYKKTALRLASIVFFSLGPVGMSRVANFAGIVEADCTSCGTFEHVFDFTLSNGDWALTGKDDHSCDLYGQYDSGNGWQVGDYGDSQHWYVLIASPEIDPTTITKIELDYIPSKVTNYAQLRNGVACPTPDPWDFLTDESNNTPFETATIVWEGTITCHQIYAVMRNGGGGVQGDGNAWITAVRVYGIGSDPFA